MDALVPPDIANDCLLDRNVCRLLPPASRVKSVHCYGASDWTDTARICVEEPDGRESHYFLKSAQNEAGHIQMQGEFSGMFELYKTMPDLVPKPYGWEKYTDSTQAKYFFLSEFTDMQVGMPEPNQLCRKLAQLHQKSISPTGMFGFHTTTCQGNTPQDVSWESSWTVFFTKLLRHVLALDIDANGFWEDFNTLSKRIVESVIPRLIGALEEGERKIKPMFDPCGSLGRKYRDIVYTRTYLRYSPPSEPGEEWDDRNRMYSIYYNVIYSVTHRDQGTAVRRRTYYDMYYLIDKYAPFEEGVGPPRLKETDRASLSKERDHTIE